jgi:uncharacterized protein (DUF1697 family)
MPLLRVVVRYSQTMTICIALLRGINVGGNNKLPMHDLRNVFEEFGCTRVQTYIQSGNVVFFYASDRDELSEQIVTSINQRFGFSPKLLLLDRDELATVIAANPFADLEHDPKLVHVWFLAETAPRADIVSIDSKLAKSESYALEGNAFYLCAPEGIGRSKLASNVEKFLGVDATARNWRTVNKLQELAAMVESHL